MVPDVSKVSSVKLTVDRIVSSCSHNACSVIFANILREAKKVTFCAQAAGHAQDAGHVLNLDVFNPRSSETHELCFLRLQHIDLYGFIPCAANALSIKPLSSSFLIRRASLSSSRFTAPIFGFCAFINRCPWTMLSTDGSGLRSKTRNKI